MTFFHALSRAIEMKEEGAMKNQTTIELTSEL